jgi:pantothenate kinase
MDLDTLLARAAGLVQDGSRAVLGITGSPGAGKTTLARALVDALAASPPPGQDADWVAHVPMDGYHLADVVLDRLGSRQRKGAPDTFDADGYSALLARLHSDTDVVVYAPAFDRELEQPVAGSIPVPPSTRLVISEGNYLLLDTDGWAGVRSHLDEVWYCDLADDERQSRLVARHTRFGKQPEAAVRWVADVDERNARLIRTTRDRADLVVPGPLLQAIGHVPSAVAVPTG